MSEQAKVMDKLAIIRSVHHDSGSHHTSIRLEQKLAICDDQPSLEESLKSRVGDLSAGNRQHFQVR